MFVFVEGDRTSLTKTNDETGELVSKCSDSLTKCWAVSVCVCVSGRGMCVCTLLKRERMYFVCVFLRMLYCIFARRISQKVMNPVGPIMIDMLSYFMGAVHACRWVSVSIHFVHKRPFRCFGPGSARRGEGRAWNRVGESGYLREKSQNLLIYCKKRKWSSDPKKHQSHTHTHTKLHINLVTAAFYQDSCLQTGWRKIKWLMSWPSPFHFGPIGALDMETRLGHWFNFWPSH